MCNSQSAGRTSNPVLQQDEIWKAQTNQMNRNFELRICCESKDDKEGESKDDKEGESAANPA
jgi:hypothetical protein